MAYDPLTGRYTPDPVKPSTFTYGQGNPLSNVYVPPVAATRATPGQFRRAEDTSNQGATAYTPTPLTETGEFVESVADPNAGFTVVGNQAFFQGKPYNGVRNGIQFINGYRQDMYTPDGKERTNNANSDLTNRQEEARLAEERRRAGQSAYDLLYSQFEQYGMGSLVESLKGFIQEGLSPAELTLRLRGTDAYRKRFAANTARIAKGLGALSEAEYIGLEDQYQNIMRNYGLPATYYTRGDMGRQEGFEKFIANDVSALELEDRIATAQKRVINANPEVTAALKQFYPDINTSDILAYTLDPEKGLEAIKRKVTAAEIGGAAIAQGLGTGAARAEELAGYGVTKEQAQQGFQTVAGVVPRGAQLASIYNATPYTQQTAEAEVFGLAGAEEAARQRKKLVGLEKAAFSGTTGAAQGALGRERAMGQGQI
jgi:hypothetical protein